MRKLNSKLIKLLIPVMAFLIAFTPFKVSAGYIYSSEGQIIMASDGFTVREESIFNLFSTGWQQLVADNDYAAFNSPADMCRYVDSNGVETIYVVDSSSNKLFLFDEHLNYIRTISTFNLDLSKFTTSQLNTIRTKEKDKTTSRFLYENGVLVGNETASINPNELTGVYRALRPLKNADGTNVLDPITEETVYQDIIYLCDAVNKQILLMDVSTEKIIQVVTLPSSLSFADKFKPVKLVTDSTGRMYVISDGVYEGILLISYQGSFMRMVGVNYTTLSFLDAIRRNFKTEEQLNAETSILPTSFRNLAIDSKNFLYTVSGPITNPDGTTDSTKMIKKINQSNNDVLKRTGYAPPQGDLIYARTGSNAGSSNFTGITVNEYGVYTVVDSRNNRLFTYSEDGNLLYISGGPGTQVTNLKIPVAVLYQGENLLVLDRGNNCIMRFEPTEFAIKINQAVAYEFVGKQNEASTIWQEVITLNPQYELAYVGVGKKLYDEGRYQEAMLYFEKGANTKYFSRAYKMYRDEKIKKYFPATMTIIGVLIALKYTLKIVKAVKNKNSYEDGDFI